MTKKIKNDGHSFSSHASNMVFEIYDLFEISHKLNSKGKPQKNVLLLMAGP